jgi:hypothetical protein
MLPPKKQARPLLATRDGGVFLLAAAMIACPMFLSSAEAQAAPAPSAAEILRLVRYSQSANEQDFNGAIRDRKIGRVDIPLKLTMSEKEVRFLFYEGDKSRNKPDQILILSLLNNRYRLEEIKSGKRADLPAARYAERVRGTDITYEDLAMRFLYWPDPRLLGEERAKGGMAWKIKCTNPVADGAYKVVDVWVSQESGALVKMVGYDVAGKAVKHFEVDKIQPHDGGWMLRRMIVRTLGAGGDSKTYLTVDPTE